MEKRLVVGTPTGCRVEGLVIRGSFCHTLLGFVSLGLGVLVCGFNPGFFRGEGFGRVLNLGSYTLEPSCKPQRQH